MNGIGAPTDQAADRPSRATEAATGPQPHATVSPRIAPGDDTFKLCQSNGYVVKATLVSPGLAPECDTFLNCEFKFLNLTTDSYFN